MRKFVGALLVVCACVAAAAEKEKELDAVFAEWSGTRTPGCALGIMRNEQLVFTRAYGMANLEHHVAITPRTVFGIQSTSKQFVAMAVVLLIQEGRLSFEEDIRKYIPELPDYGATITVRHLLEHSSGLRDIGILTQDQGLPHEELLSQAYLLRLITRQKALNHPPGAAASYTNSGYFLLPLIVERVTGERFADFMRHRIFEPLGMTRTLYRDDASSVIDDVVTGYARDDDGVWRISGNSKNNVFTTIEDLARWSANFAKPVVGSELAIRWMTTWGHLNTGETTEWGLGLSPLRYRGLEGIYFSGGGHDGTSVLARFPEQNFAMALVCNGGLTFNAETLAQKVVDIALADEIAAAQTSAPPPDPEPVPVTRAELQRSAGLYFTTSGGPRTREFRESDGKLRLGNFDLVPLGNGRFRVAGSQTEYTFATNRVRRTAPDAPATDFERVDPTKPANVDELAGTFYNDEVEADITFSVHDGKLFYALPRQEKPDPLEPIFRDAFADGPLVFRFVRDARGRVIAVKKHWDRVWTLEYRRR